MRIFFIIFSILVFGSSLMPGQAAAAPSKPLGIFICEPATGSKDAALANFCSGCGRWLFFHVGGLAQFTQTPPWWDFGRDPRELQMPNLRLPLSEAVKMTRLNGIDAVAIGSFSGTADAAKLTYQWYAAPSRAKIGASVAATGTEQQILADLPTMAQEMASRLGQVLPLPKTPNLTPADMALLGSCGWGIGSSPTFPVQQRLEALAPQSALASLLALNENLDFWPHRRQLIEQGLLKLAPGNALAVAQAADREASLFTTDSRFYILPAGIMAYPIFTVPASPVPNNLNYLIAERLMAEVRNDAPAAAQASQAALRTAPNALVAQTLLAWIYFNKADAMRHGRTTDELSDALEYQITTLNEQAIAIFTRILKEDPRESESWEFLSSAEANENTEAADASLWKAWRLDKGNPETAWWGLQLFQAKWDGDPSVLNAFAHDVADAPYQSSLEMIQAAGSLKRAGLKDLAAELTARAVSLAKSEEAANPHDLNAILTLAQADDEAQDYTDEAKMYQEMTQIDPMSAEAEHGWGKALDNQQQWQAALDAYAKCLAIYPTDERGLARNALDLTFHGPQPQANQQALSEAQEATALNARDELAFYTLGMVYENMNENDQAVAPFQKAVQDRQWAYDPLQLLLTAYDQTDQSQKAIRIGAQILQLYPNDLRAETNMSVAYLALKDPKDALPLLEDCIAQGPNDPNVLEMYGEALYGTGQKSQAKIEWQQAAQIDPNGDSGKEAKSLLQKDFPATP